VKTFVAIVQQGMVLDQRAVAGCRNEADAQAEADAAAKKLNDEQTGFGEGWNAVVLAVEMKS
jgi:hypothetical protein